jgi:hypothetical protein
MSPIVDPARAAELLTTVDRPSPAKASLLTLGEKRHRAGRLVRLAIVRSDLKFQAVSDKDHGQLSREIDDKEKLSFHEMYATWPPEVWRELIALLAAEFGGDVQTVITIRRIA